MTYCPWQFLVSLCSLRKRGWNEKKQAMLLWRLYISTISPKLMTIRDCRPFWTHRPDGSILPPHFHHITASFVCRACDQGSTAETISYVTFKYHLFCRDIWPIWQLINSNHDINDSDVIAKEWHLTAFPNPCNVYFLESVVCFPLISYMSIYLDRFSHPAFNLRKGCLV